MILCSSEIAEEPYKISTINTEIESMEELFALCLEDPFWIDESLFNEEFIHWVSTQQCRTKISDELAQLLNIGTSCDQLLNCLFQETDYLSEEEKKKIIFEVAQNQSISETEKFLRYGDRYYKNGEYKSALLEYLRLLSSDEKNMTVEMKARVYYNLASAYAKLLYYEQAIHFYNKSNELVPRERTIELVQKLTFLQGLKPDDFISLSDNELTHLKEIYRNTAQ